MLAYYLAGNYLFTCSACPVFGLLYGCFCIRFCIRFSIGFCIRFGIGFCIGFSIRFGICIGFGICIWLWSLMAVGWLFCLALYLAMSASFGTNISGWLWTGYNCNNPNLDYSGSDTVFGSVSGTVSGSVSSSGWLCVGVGNCIGVASVSGCSGFLAGCIWLGLGILALALAGS